jgi:hypothetical protein
VDSAALKAAEAQTPSTTGGAQSGTQADID